MFCFVLFCFEGVFTCTNDKFLALSGMMQYNSTYNITGTLLMTTVRSAHVTAFMTGVTGVRRGTCRKESTCQSLLADGRIWNPSVRGQYRSPPTMPNMKVLLRLRYVTD